jgi:short-subunit dehydrogenase
VVALSEQLHHSLVQQNAKIKASVLCPGWVHTQIMNSERNRPAELQNEPRNKPLSPQQESVIREMYQALQAGILPQQVAEHTFRAIRAEQFYILTHPEYNPMVQKRMEDILQQRNPA